MGTEKKKEWGAKKKWVTKDESKGVRKNMWLSLQEIKRGKLAQVWFFTLDYFRRCTHKKAFFIDSLGRLTLTFQKSLSVRLYN